MKGTFLIFFALLCLELGCTTLIPPQNVKNSAIKKKQEYSMFPVDLDCSIRSLAYSYAAQILPSNADLNEIFNSLNFPQCNLTTQRTNNPNKKRKFGLHFASSLAFNLYVSPKGNDNNPGTENSPFLTIQRAQLQIRLNSLINGPSNIPINVYLMGGTYYLGNLGPVVFTPSDSGTSSNPINYYPYTNVDVVEISGGVPLTNLRWEPFSNGTFVTKLSSRLNFTTLFVNGQRMIRARFPNGNPTIPWNGYINANGGPDQPPQSGIEISVNLPTRDQPSWSTFDAISGGPTSRFKTFNSPFIASSVPNAFFFNKTTWTQNSWGNPQIAVVHMFHPYLWGNWQFLVKSIDYQYNTINFMYGGWQESRGGPIDDNLFYVENVFEELDAEQEWFLDVDNQLLFFKPPKGLNISEAQFVAPLLNSVFEFRGFDDNPVSFININNLVITHTATTFFEPYEVPSGGDWSIYRGGAVFVESATNIHIRACTFDQNGGNSIFFSKSVKNSTIVNNYIYGSGDSAIAFVGETNLVVGTLDRAPSNNYILNNHIHDIGIYGKQTAGFFQSISYSNTILNNVIYNAPRAGICFNDGYRGGNIIQGNLIFNVVRESGDHGAFNSWDRQVYTWSYNNDPFNTFITPMTNKINGNFLINKNYWGTTPAFWTIDHDDGSSYYLDTNNLLIYGGVKYRDGMNRDSRGNLIIGEDNHGVDFQVLYPQSVDTFFNNTVIMYSATFYGCAYLPDQPNFSTNQNFLYAPGNLTYNFIAEDCGANWTSISQFSVWNSMGYDLNTVLATNITTSQIIDMTKRFVQSLF